MTSQRIVDLRKRKPGLSDRQVGSRPPARGARAGMRWLSFREAPPQPQRLRSRRRRVRLVIALGILAAFGGAAYGASWASYLPQLSLQRITVEGAREIRREVVRAYVETQLHNGSHGLLSRANIFLYPRAEMELAIAKYFPRIRDVHVSRESLLALAIVVSVEEREPFARWCALLTSDDYPCYFMDQSGVIFAPLEVRPQNGLPAGAGPLTGFAPLATTTRATKTQYVFRGGLPAGRQGQSAISSPIGQTYLPGAFAGILALLERLGQAGFTPHTISVEGEQDFSVNMSRGFTIRASFGGDVSALVKNLELVLSSETLRGKEEQLEYIDLRFGNRVYYKLRGEEQQSRE